MPRDAEGKGDATPLLIAGAMVGVIGALLAMMGLVNSVDAHYVTRREYEATMVSINQHLERLEPSRTEHAPASDRR